MRRHRLALALAGLNLMLLVTVWIREQPASASSVPEIVRARAIELVDEHGRVRAQINVEPSGEAVLRLRDPDGQVRVKLGADRDGSGLLLLDGSTEPGVHMLANSSGTTLTLTNRRGQRRQIKP
jgi:hypothetical protein